MATMMAQVPYEIWATIFGVLTPAELFTTRRVCRTWKTICEKVVTNKILTLTQSNHLVGKIDFSRILRDYSILLKFPFGASSTISKGPRRTYFRINVSHFDCAELSNDYGCPLSGSNGIQHAWTVLDGATGLETADRILVVSVLPFENEDSGDILSITIFKRGPLEKGINIFTEWPILKKVQIPLPFSFGIRYEIDMMLGCVHTIIFSIICPDLPNTFNILSDAYMKKILFIQDLEEGSGPMFLHEQYGWLTWQRNDSLYELGNPSWISNFKHLDGYWLVSYWQHVIENFLIWKFEDFCTFYPLDCPQMFLETTHGSIFKVPCIPCLSFNEYYSQYANPSSSSGSSVAIPDGDSAQIVEMKLSSWDNAPVLRPSVLAPSLPRHLHRDDWEGSEEWRDAEWRTRQYFIYDEKKYILYEAFRPMTGGVERKHLIVDLSEPGVRSILSETKGISYNLTTFVDACIRLNSRTSDVRENYYELPFSDPRFMVIGEMPGMLWIALLKCRQFL